VKTEGARLYEPSHITHSLEPVCGDCFIGTCDDCGRPIAASDRRYTIEIEPGEVHGYYCTGCSGDLRLDDGLTASDSIDVYGNDPYEMEG
jgi:hypothetical protein